MKRSTYKVVSTIPFLGKLISLAVDPKFSSVGLEEGLYQKEIDVVKKYLECHPEEQVTRQLIKKLMDDRN